MVASLDDSIKNKKIDDDVSDLVLGYVSKYGQFLADQSYMKSIGDLMNVAQRGGAGMANFVSNYPQQLIPYRALGGWMSRLFDDTQRMTGDKAGFLEKQMQLLMMNIPGLSQKTPARVDIEGKPIGKTSRLLEAFSPVNITKETDLAEFLNNYDEIAAETKRKTQENTIKKEAFKPRYDEIRSLIDTGKIDEAKTVLKSLTDDEYESYKSLKTTDKNKKTDDGVVRMFSVAKQVKQLVSEGKEDEAIQIVNNLSEEDYRYYKMAKAKLP
jgi:soluble cytochrome b562